MGNETHIFLIFRGFWRPWQNNMNISANKVVGITYKLTLDSGEIADEATLEHPFVFIHGIGQTLEAFDKNLEGLSLNSEFSFSLSAKEGYGENNERMVIDIPKSTFDGPDVPADILTVGNMIPMQDQEGNPLNGIILEIGGDSVKMDFNHPLADQRLHFSGKVISIRDATESELGHGHVHGPGGHEH